MRHKLLSNGTGCSIYWNESSRFEFGSVASCVRCFGRFLVWLGLGGGTFFEHFSNVDWGLSASVERVGKFFGVF